MGLLASSFQRSQAGPRRPSQPCLSPQSTVPEPSCLGIACVFICITGRSLGPPEHLHTPPVFQGLVLRSTWQVLRKYLWNERTSSIHDACDILSAFSFVPICEGSAQFTFPLKAVSVHAHSFNTHLPSADLCRSQAGAPRGAQPGHEPLQRRSSCQPDRTGDTSVHSQTLQSFALASRPTAHARLSGLWSPDPRLQLFVALPP